MKPRDVEVIAQILQNQSEMAKKALLSLPRLDLADLFRRYTDVKLLAPVAFNSVYLGESLSQILRAQNTCLSEFDSIAKALNPILMQNINSVLTVHRDSLQRLVSSLNFSNYFQEVAHTLTIWKPDPFVVLLLDAQDGDPQAQRELLEQYFRHLFRGDGEYMVALKALQVAMPRLDSWPFRQARGRLELWIAANIQWFRDDLKADQAEALNELGVVSIHEKLWLPNGDGTTLSDLIPEEDDFQIQIESQIDLELAVKKFGFLKPEQRVVRRVIDEYSLEEACFLEDISYRVMRDRLYFLVKRLN